MESTLDFIHDFGGEEHIRHLHRLERTMKVEKQLRYIELKSYDVSSIISLFGFKPESIIIHRNTMQVQQYMQDKVLYKHENRKVSWSELMFDLIFVSVFHELGKNLENNPTIDQLQLYILQFTLLWCAWGNGNHYLFSNILGEFVG